MKSFKNSQSTKAKLPENEKNIGGDADRKMINNRVPIIQQVLKSMGGRNGKK